MRLRVGRILAAAAIAILASAAPALANEWAGSDPSSNFSLGELPQECGSDPTGATCVDFSVAILDQARTSLGQSPYVLPADFDSLTAAQQVFILVNSDRTLYGLSPIPGLTGALNQDAAQGVRTDNDPTPSDSSWTMYTSNWAGGYENVVLAYEGWMYDDGAGSGNLDCTPTDSSGCWGHRHDILWRFDPGGPLAMGAAAGTDSTGWSGYSMLLEQGDSSLHPSYTYTWSDAVADGAGGPAGTDVGGSGSTSGSDTGSSGSGSHSGSGSSASTGSPADSGTPAGSGTPSGSGTPAGSPPSSAPGAHGASTMIALGRVWIRRHRIALRVSTPRGTPLHCALSQRTHGQWLVRRSKRCYPHAVFRHVPAGRYRLRISSTLGTLVRRIVVH